MIRFSHHILSSVLLLSLFTAQQSVAQSTLMITTPRVVLEGRARSASVNLKNTGDSAGSYRVFFRDKAMTTKGTVETIASNEHPDWSAARMIRYSPRRVTLAAQKGQRIRLALRKPAELPEGEYRSHLIFRSEPDKTAALPDTEKASTEFRPTFEFSIPVIIRHGQTSATAKLSTPTLLKQGKQDVLQLTLHRTGNRSLFGDIEILGLTNASDKGTSLYEQRGLAHYTPLEQRDISIRLPQNLNLQRYSHLKVIFQEREKYGGNERAELVFAP